MLSDLYQLHHDGMLFVCQRTLSSCSRWLPVQSQDLTSLPRRVSQPQRPKEAADWRPSFSGADHPTHVWQSITAYIRCMLKRFVRLSLSSLRLPRHVSLANTISHLQNGHGSDSGDMKSYEWENHASRTRSTIAGLEIGKSHLRPAAVQLDDIDTSG